MESQNYEHLHEQFPKNQVSEELDFQTADGLRLHGWRVEAQGGSPRGNVVIVHGSKDYSERYLDFAQNLSRAGYQVFGYDQRGHGRSQGERNYFPRFENVVDDLRLAVIKFKHFDNKMPWFIMGHSMGGNVVSRFAVDYQDQIDGFILSAPLLKRMPALNNFVVGALKFINSFAPHLGMVDLPDKDFSKDRSVVESMIHDPLINHGKIQARSAVEILGNVDYVAANRSDIKIPFLVMHGDHDRVNNIEGSREFFRGTGDIAGKELKIYEGLWHDLLHEPEKKQIESDIISWINTMAIKH